MENTTPAAKPRGRKPTHPILLAAWDAQHEAAASGKPFDKEAYLTAHGYYATTESVPAPKKVHAHVNPDAATPPRGRKPTHPILLAAWHAQHEAAASGKPFDREAFLSESGYTPEMAAQNGSGHKLALSRGPLIEDRPQDAELDDAAVLARTARQFQSLRKFTTGICSGAITAFIVSGRGGLGKSYNIEEIVDSFQDEDEIVAKVVSGAVSPVQLVQLLWQHRMPNGVLVLDDCDGVLFDEDSLNLMKAALDTKKTRRISWMKNSKTLEDAGIPHSFAFEGRIIFSTNLDFDAYIASGIAPKLTPHLEALMSRVHYLDLRLHTLREVVLWTEFSVRKHNILVIQKNLTKDAQEEIIGWIVKNKKFLRFPSIRTALKLAELYVMDAKTWKSEAEKSELRAA